MNIWIKSVLNWIEVQALALYYDECIIDGDAMKVYFYLNGKFKRSARIV